MAVFGVSWPLKKVPGTIFAIFAAILLEGSGMAAEQMTWNPRPFLVKRLAECVQPILDSQDAETGRFGTKPWTCRDQNALFPLAVAWSQGHPDNPWHHDRKLLEAILLGGEALVDAQDRRGMWTFRKKDGSTWGQIAMPWTYSRWVRAFALVKDAMPAGRRAKWEKGLRLGYTTIAGRELRRIHNIPCHHAMGLYCAGQVFGRDDWKTQAAAFMRRVVGKQERDGYWSEHTGPVVRYNFVYVEALGCYHAMSGDRTVLPALRKASVFHANLTYPDGTVVETVDERNPYHPGAIPIGNAGFSFSAEGRGHMLRQLERLKAAGREIGADVAAQLLLHGATGPARLFAADEAWTSSDGRIGVLRSGPWFLVGSAHTAPVSHSRWIQDRQNFVSIFHRKTGLIVGGGNTKLQPYWSNFTVGDRSLLTHKPGDRSPSFRPSEGLRHVPRAAKLKLAIAKGTPGVDLRLNYGPEQATVLAVPEGDSTLRLTCVCKLKGKRPVHGHLTLIPRLGRVIRTGSGKSRKLDGKGIDWSGKACGGWIEHAGWRLALPAGARILWPKRRHNPYRKTGRSTLAEARIVIETTFTAEAPRHEFVLTIR